MKKFFLAIISFTVISCNVDRSPFDAKESDDVLSNSTGLKSITLGNYALLKGDASGGGFFNNLYRVGEYGGDNIDISGTTTDEFFYYYNYRSIKNNGRSNVIWNAGYKTIVGANRAILKFAEGKDDTTDQLLGENYFLRAYVYFSLVNVFAKPYNQGRQNLGVPLKISDDVNDLPGRATVGEIYDQIVKDLLKAEQLMTQDKGNIYASKFAAEALLSRVYLYMEDNMKSIEYADKVINAGKYTLLSTTELPLYATKAPEINSETIFAFKYNKDGDYSDGWYTIGSMYANIQNVGWGEMYASSTYLELINQNPKDARAKFIQPRYLDKDSQVVYWVQKGTNTSGAVTYTYQIQKLTNKNGGQYFTYNNAEYKVQSEVLPNKTNTYFINADGTKINVTVDYNLDKRNGYPKFYILKCSLQDGVPQLWSPVIVRLAEMYLNRAEAYAKQGNTAAALADVNVIRTRAGIPVYSSVPAGMTILDVVLQERRLELAFEAQRKYDVFRNKQTLDRNYPGTHLNGNNPFYTVPYTNNRTIEYIPEQQILIQPNLVQNPD
ncbi:carbohydrate-binding protein SusD [Elizabethkingia meningoseptica]|uniref:RagB/SusD family nutrient uptake outer membrane protein n=1 Tax=Elizabethkingia meningoseptica TaxID=238 RepID=UPI000332CD2A|nr:RagB/SusD family nutrient uptake outer membrane protein [Elizabethkingia meningoseptica]AQX04644.1 carbohydrate-binding protein SusD [Elizabethkingia meningoseptica]AQX46687.1 carbohydrate-binding protein SusD [Elizabethkingia meningoseptica]EOR31342.1 ragB/SusD family protein [Elizabethkingia meningoseptica ATCC 13253 = NBRC 12535]KUY19201.1 carbohydrate-binding protein SusD [Elizabethkingia meningoseptica]MDE5431516.1 RagB/SusD family nutrient uptake outer membrane protein [Elizabethkingi